MNELEHISDICMEECAEIIQAISKALRFGFSDFKPGEKETNSERIVNEYADLIAVMRMLEDRGVISFDGLSGKINAKIIKVRKYLKHSTALGTLS